MNDTTRRGLVTRLLVMAGTALTAAPAFPRWSLAQETGAARGEASRAFMQHALVLRTRAVQAGDQGYGAVVVKDGRVVGEGPSRVVVNRDPTAHAEMEAIRDAARRLGTGDLDACVIYATSRPCAMCEAASYWARISRIYFSEAVTDGGRPRYPSC